MGVTRSIGGPAAYTGASPSSASVAGAGTGSVPCAHSTVPLPTFNGEASQRSTPRMRAARGGADDVDDGVDRADFVEVNLLDGHRVNLRFGLTEQLKRAAGARFHRSVRGACGNDSKDCRKRAMRLMLVFVSMVVRVDSAVGMLVFMAVR